MIRSFIALELSDGLRRELAKLIEDLKKGMQFTSARPSWVNPNGIHLTLKFLGNIEERLVGDIARSLEEIAADTVHAASSLHSALRVPHGGHTPRLY
mgnify:CR=1 FL=1